MSVITCSPISLSGVEEPKEEEDDDECDLGFEIVFDNLNLH
jgi:hypothetical protein